MIRRPPRSTRVRSSAASDVYKRQAWVLLRLIGLVTNLALFHRFGWSIPSLADLPPSPWLVVAALLGGLAVSLIAWWAPNVRGHGIPEAMEAVLTRQSRM